MSANWLRKTCVSIADFSHSSLKQRRSYAPFHRFCLEKCCSYFSSDLIEAHFRFLKVTLKCTDWMNPRLLRLLGPCGTHDECKGKRLSHALHSTFARSSFGLPLLKSIRAPSCKALNPKSWQSLLGQLPPSPVVFHNGHPACTAATRLVSKVPKTLAMPGGGDFGGSANNGGGAEGIAMMSRALASRA